MSTNLANVYADMLRLHADNFTIIYAPAPSYLLNIIGTAEAQGKAVLLYKEDRTKITSALNDVLPKSENNKKVNGNDLDLTGSPLKDDCLVEAIEDMSFNLMKLVNVNPWRLDEESHTGIDVNKARAIVNSHHFQQVDATTKGSVWFLCNGKDAQRTLLLQYEFVKGYFSRGIINYLGYLPINDLHSKQLMKQHYAHFPATNTVETKVQNTYMIKANATICCEWISNAKEPSLVGLATCDITLTQKFHLRNCNVHTQDLMDQLRLLILLRDGILSYKAAQTEKEPEYCCGRGIEMEELQQSIAIVLNEMSGFAEINSSNSVDTDLESVVHRSKVRRLTDLTDKLFEILKRCSSYNDLKTAFLMLFQIAARKNVVNAPHNKNRLADIIIEVANCRLAIPCLTGTEPLELLLEMGLEKLQKDYEYIFTESKICSAKTLFNLGSTEAEAANSADISNIRQSIRKAVRSEVVTPRKTLLHEHKNSTAKFKLEQEKSIGFKNSNFNEHSSAVTLAKLLQIHCVLEHLLMLHATFNLSNVYSEICERLLKAPLRNIEHVDDALVDEMTLTLSSHQLGECLDGQEPHSRRIRMLSKDEFREFSTTFYYNRENVCPPSIAEDIAIKDEDLLAENNYYAWIYRKIKSIAPNTGN